MKLISHRGNIHGKIVERENAPDYIDEAIRQGYDVEVDVWRKGADISLGHDYAEFAISIDWLLERHSKLWIHCKDYDSLAYLVDFHKELNFFHHGAEEPYVLTSHCHIWSYPGYPGGNNTICLLPEYFPQDTSSFWGICSDYIGDIDVKTGTFRSGWSAD